MAIINSGSANVTMFSKTSVGEAPDALVTAFKKRKWSFHCAEAESKKPKFKITKNLVTVMDPFYVLPEKLLIACMNVLPVRNTEDSALSVDASQEGVADDRKRSKQVQWKL
ncbi:hypothetical protein PR002_g11954 [Phytophthora rubi]|uniref:Uncharacterized protein n=1 Tax=Phytophthora rubi TaxID=129364 RepID=A0A6A3M2U3_9STRA|nr:hypothetical protein PR002_g11954 [Phytophthora rubi]